MKEELTFSTLRLIIGGEIPMMETFEPVCDIKEDNFILNENYYLITTKSIDDKYLWLYAQHGKSTPYSKIVVHAETREKEPNPRSEKQIETSKQLFGLYSMEEHILYLSNLKQKSLFENYLGGKIKRGVIIKNLLKEPEEFFEQIKKVKQIKFTVLRNIFNNKEGGVRDILPTPDDVFGLGCPEDFTLEANFQNAKPTRSFLRQV